MTRQTGNRRALRHCKPLRWVLACTLAMACTWTAAPHLHAEPPADVWRRIFARPEPATAASVATNARTLLGRQLFASAILSDDGKRSCAECHQPEQAFTDGLSRALGRDGRPLQRNTPTLLGIAHADAFNWDRGAARLDDQFERPITSSDELAGSWDRIMKRLAGDPRWSQSFAAAFPEDKEPTRSHVASALAAYLTTLDPPRSQFDAWIGGNGTALDAQERDGFQLFVGKGQCVTCHAGWRFTDDKLHDVGLPPEPVTERTAFKTPTLRGLSRSAPYMHDGSKTTLADVVDHYAGSLIDRPSLAPNVRRGLELSTPERAALVAFLLAISAPNEPR